MPITLITGTPGAGKTLYGVSKALPALAAETLKSDDGAEIKRRLCVGGVRDLLIDHEPVDVPKIEWESYRDEWSSMERLPGTPPLDVPRRADNWWLWVEPGDVLFIDEAQRLFRPMAAGRKLPGFITMLETHRHYGIDIFIVTQHPNLIHANVRNLVGRHLHVRRVFTFHRRIVYEWDKTTNPQSISSATKTAWAPDKKAYSVYKSAELHTKSGTSVPFVALLLFVAVLALPAAFWYAYNRSPGAKVEQPASTPVGVQPAIDSGPVTQAPGEPPRVTPGPPAFVDAVAPQQTWPLIIVGCWQQGDDCQCITREERPRIVRHAVGLCTAIVAGDLQPPPGLPRPQRVEPGQVVPVASSASAPLPSLGIGT